MRKKVLHRKSGPGNRKYPPAATEIGRDGRGRFPKGISGNPSGRPKKLVEFVELAREKGSPRAFAALRRITKQGGDERAVVQAALGLLAYAWGKPKQAVELTGKDGAPVEVTNVRERLTARIAARLAALEAKRGTGEPERRRS
jgi:hypothetical protein